tara:strand:+ start:981 stop:1136 length:156 start_codon:yes stop_codon:yes gene_type:complete
MIKDIIDNLQNVEATTENLKIAKGKNKLPSTLKEAYKTLKNELKWQIIKQK